MVIDEELHEEGVADSIDSSDDDFLRLQIGVDALVLVNEVHPVLPGSLFREVNNFIDGIAVREVELLDAVDAFDVTTQQLLEEDVELFTVVGVD